MNKNKNMKLNEKMIKNRINKEDDEDMEEMQKLRHLDMNEDFKISRKEAVDTLSYMLSVMYYSVAEDLYVSVFTKSDRQDLLNLISNVQNKLKTIKC